MSEKILDELCLFALDTKSKDLPHNIKNIIKLSIADWISVLIAGNNEPVSKIIKNLIKQENGNAESTIIGLEKKFPTRAASLVNGTVSHSLDYDDTHFCYVGHPSVSVLPASLALSEKINATFNEFLEASLIGVESNCRIGLWIGMEHYKKGFHNTSTIGVFGATLASCRLLKLNFEQTKNAIGIASSKASGLKAQFGTMGKPYHAGISASSGVESALLAKEGFVSSTSSFYGEQGFAKTHFGEFNIKSFDNLGKIFIFDDVLHKYHACCHGLHSTIEAIEKIKKKNKFQVNEITKINVLINPKWLKVCNIESPTSGLEIKFSFKMICALVLQNYNTASLDTYSDIACSDVSLLSIKEKVIVNGDIKLNDTSAQVEIILKNNKPITDFFDISVIQSYDIRKNKLLSKISSLLGEKNSNSLWNFLNEESKLPSEWIQNYMR